jgi:hypothetical protein
MARNDKTVADGGSGVDPERAAEIGASEAAAEAGTGAESGDELAELRAENARLRALLDNRDARGVSLTTDREATAETRRRQAEHERAVMDRSEGARLDREQQENLRAAGEPVLFDEQDDAAEPVDEEQELREAREAEIHREGVPE